MMKFLNEDVLREFIRRLPEITPSIPNVHLIMLAIRSRFAKQQFGIKIKDLVVERKVIRPYADWQKNYFARVFNLATLAQYGYYSYSDLRIVPGCFGIYGTIIPRHVKNAIGNILNETTKYLLSNDTTNMNNYISRLDVRYFGRLHANKDSKAAKVVTLDVDIPAAYPGIRDMVSPFDVWMVTKTSRGFHIILNLNKRETAKEFYQGGGVWARILAKYKSAVELQRDPQEPIPGTLYFRPDSPGELNYVEIIE
jgi:hypothetical protein